MMQGQQSITEILLRLRQYLGMDVRDPKTQKALQEATLALRQLPESEGQSLVDALEDSYGKARQTPIEMLVCSAICEAIAARHERLAVPLLGRMLVDPAAAAIREDLAEILGLLGDTEAVPMLIETLNDSETWVRAKAACSLGNLATPASSAALLRLLEDDAEVVREHAIGALAELGEATASSSLITVLQQDEDDDVRAAAARALGELGSKDASVALQKIADCTEDVELRDAATVALEQIGE